MAQAASTARATPGGWPTSTSARSGRPAGRGRWSSATGCAADADERAAYAGMKTELAGRVATTGAYAEAKEPWFDGGRRPGARLGRRDRLARTASPTWRRAP